MTLALLLALGCSGSSASADSGSPAATCVGGGAVVTDIDETLTTLDSEWTAQIIDASDVPDMRPDADAVFRAYAELGYHAFYVTARGTDITVSDGRTSTEATEDWLVEKGFPYAPGDLFLAPGVGVLGDGAVDYKSGVIADLQAQGYEFVYAYGNATTDIEAFQESGIADDHIFLVGALAGEMGVEPIPDDEAYTAHLASFLPGVEAAPPCE
jgi:phosphatidate phosphatase PAH1